MQGVIGQRRREEDIAQQHRHAHRYGRPVIELVSIDAVVEEIHPDHHQTGDVEHIEYKLGPGITQSKMINGVKHHSYGERATNRSNDYIENLSSFIESYIHF